MNIIDWLRKNNPQLLEELLLLDRATDGVLLGDPSHTLSYNIAKAASEGKLLGKVLCTGLNILSPNHCANALANESTEIWQDATDVVGIKEPI